MQKVNSDPRKKVAHVSGRMWWSNFTAAEAFKNGETSQYPAASEEVAKPSIQVVLREPQYLKLRQYCIDVFLPYCVEQYKVDKNARDALTQAHVDEIIEALMGDPSEARVNTPFKPVPESVLAAFPEAAVMVKVLGQKGKDMTRKAKIMSIQEMKQPDPDVLTFPQYLKIDETTHQFYRGAWIIVNKLSLYAYLNNKTPGFSLGTAGAGEVVFTRDDTEFQSGDATTIEDLEAAEADA